MTQTVCSTTHVFHYFISPIHETLQSFLDDGIRPLSDFPDSERWKQLEAQIPDFYPKLYKMIAEPVLGTPYKNSGIFVTPIDFRKMPGTFLHDKGRFNIPVDRVDPAQTVVTYVLNDMRTNLPFTPANLESTAELWDEALVRQWFGLDNTKVFFYVPQVAAYEGKITVTMDDFSEA